MQIDILFCGVCHSDLHQVPNEGSGVMLTVYPSVPGHEIVGHVTKVGSGEKPLSVDVFGLIFGRRSFSGSPIGGIPETQKMLNFCGQHNITADVEVIPIQKINEAYGKLLKSDVNYRFSIDMASLKSA